MLTPRQLRVATASIGTILALIIPSGALASTPTQELRGHVDQGVYDVIIEGVSLIANYRTQFNKVIQTSSFDDLVARLRSKEFSAPAS